MLRTIMKNNNYKKCHSNIISSFFDGFILNLLTCYLFLKIFYGILLF